MTSATHDDNRRVIPIWRRFDDAERSGELQSAGMKHKGSVRMPHLGQNGLRKEVSVARGHWEADPNIDSAIEVVSASMLLGAPELAKDAAEFLLTKSANLNLGTVDVARGLIRKLPQTSKHQIEHRPTDRVIFSADAAEGDKIKRRISISQARLFTREWPENPIAWSNLALAHAELGSIEKAKSSAEIAFQLAPENRLMLRNLVRMYIHNGEPDKAHHVLMRSGRTAYDPWLLAAEISTSDVADRSPKYAKKARDAIKEREWGAFDSSELASSMATLAFKEGNLKGAKKFLNRSLDDPTENVIAQTEWLTQRGLVPSQSWLSESHFAPEARALRRKADNQFKESLAMFAAWLDQEPYSSRPAIDGSFVASVGMSDPDATIYFSLRGLVANVSDWVLWNNLAVGHFLKGEVQQGISALERAKQLAHHAALHGTVRATEGMAYFCQGRVAEGRACYKSAIEHFVRTREGNSAQIAALYLIQEELKQPQPNLDEKILNLSSKKTDGKPEIAAMVGRIQEWLRSVQTR